MNFRLISGFFAKLIFIPKSFFDSISTGDMVARMNDARRIQRVVISLTSQVVIDLLIFIVSAGYIFFYSVSSGLLSISSIPLFGSLAWRYNAKIIDGNREVMHSYSASESKFIDTITGIRTIKAFNCEKMFIKIFSVVYHYFMNKVFSLGLLGARISFWYSVVSAILLALIIGWNSFLVLRDQLTIGQMMAIITLIGNLVSSAGSIAMANIQFQEARVAFDRMYEFTAIEPEYPNSRKNGKAGFSGIQRISVRNLRFRFPGRSLLLNELNFEVSKGEIAVLFGAIGCGKSTILAVLQRFYGYESGTITVDGFDWSEIPTDGWRDKVAVVEQHLRFFNGTLLENISLQVHPDPAKVIEFCKQYGFHDFFDEFPQGYATLVNENSTNLSGGQQQLIALARALYRCPQLLLLDEVTSAMDRKTEHFVIDLLQRIKSDTAVLLVTHRPQLARHADTIIVIENQTVSACGKHQELYKTNLFYRASFDEIVA